MYKTIESVLNVRAILIHGTSCHSNMHFVGTVLTDRCHCPYRPLDQWLSDFQCPHSYDQINANLAPFQNEGIELEDIYNRLTREFSYVHGVHYSIVDNKVC